MKTILSIIVVLMFTTILHADYSNNPNCKGYGILQHQEKQKCLAENPAAKKKSIVKDGKIDTSGIRDKTGKIFKKLGLNTDSKLLKTGKYSENK
jgi:hypothetical protein